MDNTQIAGPNLYNIVDNQKEKVVVVGLRIGNDSGFEHSMEELVSLCEAADMEVIGKITQALPAPHGALYIGTGKVEEVKELSTNLEADIIVFDNALSPSQVRNLSGHLSLPILDRTALILEIFNLRAQTKEAKLQVELARLQYLLPRLAGLGKSMSRQGGASGSKSSKGSGEKKLELDRRHIEHRIDECKKEIEAVRRNRITQRKSRMASSLPQVSLVGYTNAGKSTVMNKMLSLYGNQDISNNEHKLVFEKNMLFATLDTTVRKITPPGKHSFYLSDTVGFISKLPHNLVDAFRSTLEEACVADLLLQVVDLSDPHYKDHINVTNETLSSLGAGDIPMIIVYNKCDKVDNLEVNISHIHENTIHIAAKKELGLEKLLDFVLATLYKDNENVNLLLPYSEGSLLNMLIKEATVQTQEYRDNGIYVEATVNKQQLYKVENFII